MGLAGLPPRGMESYFKGSVYQYHAQASFRLDLHVFIFVMAAIVLFEKVRARVPVQFGKAH